jgi:hypothetical protein
VDTACSSGLTAVVHAVRALRNGEADLALAGGISVQPVLTRQADRQAIPGLDSPTGGCRPFADTADGTVGGEGGAVILLKPLAAAVADGDNVLAVVRGAAVNHNGYRAASMSAPSQVGQAEVITEAWRDADIDPRSTDFIECHGSATPLGDVVEVDALRRAFLDAGVTEPSCQLGSVKANIGHLGGAAGIAGLVKAVCGLRYGVRYPHPHFTGPNPLIDFTGPVYVDPSSGPWEGTPRRAGVSSTGLTGTNVHVVLEQAPDRPALAEPLGRELVTISAKSPAALDTYRCRLADFAEATPHSLAAVAHAMNRGRDDHPYRLAVVVASTVELAGALRTAVLPEEPAPTDPRIVLLFSGDGRLDADADEPSDRPADEDPRSLLVRRQFALYERISAHGVTDTDFIGSGAGNFAVRAARGELTLAEAERAATGVAGAPVDPDRLREVVDGFRRGRVVFVEVGADGELSRQIRRVAPDLPVVAERDVLDLLARVYALGGAVDWEHRYRGTRLPRIEAPSYPFEPIRCWVTDAVAPPATATRTASPATAKGTAPPATANRTALPAVAGRAALPVAAGADTVGTIEAVWREVLKADDVDADSDYFALGGTSIAGISVLRRLADRLGVNLTFADLYAHRTVRSLAERVDGLRTAGDAIQPVRLIEPIPRGGRLPLSYGQEQLWYLDQLNPSSPLYNIPAALRLRGHLDAGALRDAFQDLAERHEVLRTCIRSADGEPYALVLPAGSDLSVIDLSALPPADRQREARRLVDGEAVRPFDLAEGPLLRTTLLRFGDDEHALMYTVHHIVFDGWSPSVFFRDLFEFYAARVAGRPPELPKLPIQYADFAAWQRSWFSGERLESELDFWRDELAGLRTGELPTDRPRPPVQSFAGDLVPFTIDAALAGRAREFSRRRGVTTFVTMLALVDALLHRWAGLRDIVIGVGTSGRTNPATHDLIGYFNNLPPFRTAVTGRETFAELVRRCADTVAGVLDHEDMPLEKIVAAVCGRRDPNRQPLFDVAYTYQNAPAAVGGAAGLTMTGFLDSPFGGIPPGTAKFDLTFGVTDQDDGEMYAYIEYAAALFDRETVSRLAGWLPTLLDAALADPDTRIDRLPGSTPKLDGKGVPTMTANGNGAPLVSTGGGGGDPEAAETLARICAELLSVDSMSPDDNFFERGGDSLLGVRVSARAARAGIHFSPQQMLQHHTLRELVSASTVDAQVAGRAPTPSPAGTAAAERAVAAAPPQVSPAGQPAGSAGSTGSAGFVGSAGSVGSTNRPIQLTPIMRDFLRRPGSARDFIVTQPLETTTRIDAETMRLAVEHVVARHEPLRYRFRRNAVGWRIDCAPPGTLDVFDTRVLPPLSEADDRAAVIADLAELRSRIDLERGPALRARFYDRGHNRGGWLVIVIHHFVFDNMATVVLIDDLDSALTELLAGRRLPAPEPVLTWREWSQHLHDMSVSDELAGELSYWTAIARAGGATGGNTVATGPDTVATGPDPAVRGATDAAVGGGAAGVITRKLGPAPEVLTAGPDAQVTAMAAFACAYARWQGTTSAYLMTEGAATTNVYRPPGRSPAIGWFTSLHPLLLPVDPDAGVRACLPEVADRTRSVPNDGVGYGILRHLSPDSPEITRLRSLPEPATLVVHSSHDGGGFTSGVRHLRNRLDLVAGEPKPGTECFPLVLASHVAADGTLWVSVLHDGRYGDVEPLADLLADAFGELA